MLLWTEWCVVLNGASMGTELWGSSAPAFPAVGIAFVLLFLFKEKWSLEGRNEDREQMDVN